MCSLPPIGKPHPSSRGGCYHDVRLIQVAAPTRASNPNLAAARLWMADGPKRRGFGLAVFVGGKALCPSTFTPEAIP